MKSTLILAAGAVCLFAVGGVARGQNAPLTTPPSTQPSMQKADLPAEPGTNTSYGGVPAPGSAAGNMRPSACTPRPQCDVFFGN